MGPFVTGPPSSGILPTLIFLAIGFWFGFILEASGFGDSRRLAGQFYFRNLSVVKVMFTAIVTAMFLVFWSSALGFLDYDQVWVDTTYLWPGIAGGFIMGIGFIVGGYCPGTSLVSTVTLKTDGLFFALGCATGIFAFGETAARFQDFWMSSFFGRFTIQGWLGVPVGVATLFVALLAIGMFWFMEEMRRMLYGSKAGMASVRERRMRRLGALVMIVGAFGLIQAGQPTLDQKWEVVGKEKQALLDNREVQIQPQELLSLMDDDDMNLVILDFRDEADSNVFHLRDAQRADVDDLAGFGQATYPPRTVFVCVDTGEERSTLAWKRLTLLQVPNVYILEHGIQGWVEQMNQLVDPAKRVFAFEKALGGRSELSKPELPHGFQLVFDKKVKVKAAPRRSGGCSS